MKVIVTKSDESVIYGGNVYVCGQSFDVADAIGESLAKRGYVEIMDEAKMQTGYLDADQLNEMSYPDLKRLAAQMGVDASGKKDELIAKICAVEVEVESDASQEAAFEPQSEDGAEVDSTPTELPNTDMPE